MSGSTLLAFDFDGTLAPICDDPQRVRLPARATILLRGAARMPGVVVAIASGRDVDDLVSRTDLNGLYLIGSHGLEIRAPGTVPIRDVPPLSVAIPPPMHARILRAGLRLEAKKHAVGLHWRGLDLRDVFPVVDDFRHWAWMADLDVIDGRCVVEARSRGGGKEEAIRWLASAIGAARVVYAGDDITDFGALRFASQRGRGIFIANDERSAPPGVTVVQSFRELFRLVRDEVLV